MISGGILAVDAGIPWDIPLAMSLKALTLILLSSAKLLEHWAKEWCLDTTTKVLW